VSAVNARTSRARGGRDRGTAGVDVPRELQIRLPQPAISGTPESVERFRETCHDMRQSLASVFALVAAALTEPDVPGSVRARLEQIVGQAEWLADMIQRCLDHTEDPALHRFSLTVTEWSSGGLVPTCRAVRPVRLLRDLTHMKPMRLAWQHSPVVPEQEPDPEGCPSPSSAADSAVLVMAYTGPYQMLKCSFTLLHLARDTC
jgi:hypothetical protein